MKILRSLLVLSTFGLLINNCTPEDTVTQVSEPSSIISIPAGTEAFSVFLSGTLVGQMEVEHGDVTNVGYEYRSNGRGPSFEETIEFGDDGVPKIWNVTGATTFGNNISEAFALLDGRATWTDTAGSSDIAVTEAKLYVAQESSPYALWVYSRLLLADADRSLAVLPSGTLGLDELETIEVTGSAGTESITTYALSGIDLNPTYFALDDTERFFAVMDSRFALVRQGFENEEQRLRDLSVEYAAQRFESIQQSVAKSFSAPLRIRNVRLFNPVTQNLTGLSSVRIQGIRITEIAAADAEGAVDEVVIDGSGGTLIAGMYEMHGHVSQDGALLNIAAGVTSIRDMGNTNEVLSELIAKIASGRLAGPRITRSGFIEGSSPFNSHSGILVASQEEALDAVRQYSNGEFHQIKIYNSMNPDWIPAMVAEAKANGLRVAGHVPAFSTADAMIAAGYDEMTHINQVMLGWVLREGEDTRTLLRLTALKRLPALSMDDPAVQKTITAMAERGVAMDPTLAIHENLLLSRNGSTAPGMLDYIDHMPVSVQRGAKTAMAEIATPEDDTAYRGAFDKIIETVKEMRDRGIQIIPGTDLGGSFTYHRELELYQLAGMTPTEILKMATLDMAEYLGQGAELGSIEPGKLADFFLIPGDPTTDLKALKTISMVVKNGVIYFPSEIYPEFGILPFIDAPEIVLPD